VRGIVKAIVFCSVVYSVDVTGECRRPGAASRGGQKGACGHTGLGGEILRRIFKCEKLKKASDVTRPAISTVPR
jgi:hypothetical protein